MSSDFIVYCCGFFVSFVVFYIIICLLVLYENKSKGDPLKEEYFVTTAALPLMMSLMWPISIPLLIIIAIGSVFYMIHIKFLSRAEKYIDKFLQKVINNDDEVDSRN